MTRAERSLRMMVEYWLAPLPGRPVRVVEFRNRPFRGECYVCVEALTSVGLVAMFFFRHRDGTWRIFPPNQDRPAMSIRRFNDFINGPFDK
ncbi:hypothetical protein E1N52_34155 [Paraburkholderia guartelaensis]|uniref:Uncharacterized protein n=1 Tax=Paraburkholderia guartelaensis TaxID=2546446 RepID=A0A4R5L4U4_9BURK|nr:hypothetical protein [Paraburkholderia guartelaensis]TDG03536.1 hypothetical protein E1N52_34155 [Paraburkholderia guartelaensis]